MAEAPVPGKMSFSSAKRHSVVSAQADGDPEKGVVVDASGVEGKPMLARKLQGRHMQMIAIGKFLRLFLI